ncbi:phage major capsid protein [Candidatus Accumulibacter sp. ACC007]|uniref:phage major capsid protein n=1 Tax=Candidatus Accumulibacter sp. ACC007 TaxID=2823333 RepID=UPI0025BDECFE|nr:phage major capsid protein [Candidatus Accumulibacter sp. ACC007]
MNKAFTQLTIKSFDQTEGLLRGIATTPATDKVGDIVEPLGAQFSLPIPLHHEHDRKDVVGQVIEAVATAEGIEFTARVAKDLSDQIAEVWRRVSGGLIKYVSVGFRPIASESIAGGTGTRFTQWAWDELSLTTIPANPHAAILATKSSNNLSISMVPKMNIAEQIQQFEVKKSAALASMDGLISKGITLADEDDAAYQAHEAEVAQIDKHLARLKQAETRGAQAALPVGVQSIQVVDNAPKGTDFVRYTKALALSRGNPLMAVEVAKNLNYGPRVENVLKAAVAAGTTTSADFTSLIQPQMMTSEFIDLLRPNLIVSKMSQVRNVPMNIKMPRTSTGTTSGWVGEGKPAPITNAAFTDLSIGEHKLGAIAVFTEELLRRSEPAAEAMVTNDLINTVATAIDAAFIDQSNAGVGGVKPASIANAATTAATAGPTAANVRTDVKAAYLNASTANQPLSSAVWVMHPATALALSMMTNATTGLREFPGVDFVTGGTFEGLPVIISTSVPGSAGTGYDVVLAVQNEILLAEGGLSIDASREASLEMNDAPTNNSATPTATTLVSLWQSGSVAIKAIRGITWTRRRPTAVYRISACKYA